MSDAKPTAPHPPGAEPPAGDPSMEDILASIRRILSDDEAEPPAVPPSDEPHEAKPTPSRRDAALDVLALDAGMIVDEPPHRLAAPAEPSPIIPPQPALPAPPSVPTPPPQPVMEPIMERHPDPEPTPRHDLVAPEAAAAAASSVGALLRTLGAGREQTQVHRGGPTIEDIVREEIRPLLKQWLDDQLPTMVERLVRAEIERVVGRAG